MKHLFLIIFLFSFSSCGIKTDTFQPAPKEEAQQKIEIIFEVEEDMFPYSWRGGDINGKARPLEEQEHERSMKLVKKAMDKYPDGFLEQYITRVYVLDYLEFYGLAFGGTNSDDVVYIVNQGKTMGYTDEYVEQTFHHEFSSILFRKNPDSFNRQGWIACNKNFTYGTGGVDALRDNTSSTEMDTYYAEMGVLCQYATSDIEEDFNTFAEQLFCASEGFWELTNDFPLLNKKLKLIVQFYQKLDPLFTLQYFSKISEE